MGKETLDITFEETLQGFSFLCIFVLKYIYPGMTLQCLFVFNVLRIHLYTPVRLY